jgi:hypothetical protein
MSLGLISNPIPAGLSSWLLSSRAMLEEELEQSYIHGIIDVDVRAATFLLLLPTSTARHVYVTLRLAAVRASVAAMYREVDVEDARSLARLAKGMGNAKRIQVCVRFDYEANLTRMLDFSPIALLTQECVEVVVSGVEIRGDGDFAVLGALTDLVDDFGDGDVQVGRNVPPLPRRMGFQTGAKVCSWWCVFWRE